MDFVEPSSYLIIRQENNCGSKAAVCCNVAQLSRLLRRYGLLLKVKLAEACKTDGPRNVAFAEYLFPSDARRAAVETDGFEIAAGSSLRVNLVERKEKEGKLVYCYIKPEHSEVNSYLCLENEGKIYSEVEFKKTSDTQFSRKGYHPVIESRLGLYHHKNLSRYNRKVVFSMANSNVSSLLDILDSSLKSNPSYELSYEFFLNFISVLKLKYCEDSEKNDVIQVPHNLKYRKEFKNDILKLL